LRYILFIALAFWGGIALMMNLGIAEKRRITADRQELQAMLWECDYSPHPISDAAWEIYRTGMIPFGTAGYYTSIIKSANIDASICLKEALPERWKGRDISWKPPVDG